MRILIISNLYPPYYVGGYELGCYEAVEWLKASGHQVEVLTSTYGVDEFRYEHGIYRWFRLQVLEAKKTDGLSGFMQLFLIEIEAYLAIKKLFFNFNPDLVYIWNPINIPVSLISFIQRYETPICYFVFDHWLSKWQAEKMQNPWFLMWHRPPKRILSKLGKNLTRFLLKKIGLTLSPNSLNLCCVHFASHYLKDITLQADQSLEHAQVIHWGIKINKYAYKQASSIPHRLLYVGQLVHHKGVHTVIQALSYIVNQKKYPSISLTIAGGTTTPDYEAYVKELVSSLSLEKNVDFIGLIPHEHLISIYQQHDILVFPSVWEEPFGITLLEGMASGLPVVSTANGGSREIVKDEINALTFPKENAELCASKVMRLLDNPELFETLRLNARLEVERQFDFDETMKSIEICLCQTLAKSRDNHNLSE